MSARSNEKLQPYRSKRSFSATPEPAAQAAIPRDGPLLFVVQQHAARRLHFDFRLELDGVLKSWAVPKGLLLRPGEKHLAVPTEDHPLDYAAFEGVIPPKQYGAGQVVVWDCGLYSPDSEDKLDFDRREQAERRVRAELAQGKLSVFLLGHKLKGSYALVRTKDETWLLLKHKDRRPIIAPNGVAEERSVLSGLTVDRMSAEVARVPLERLVAHGPAETLPQKLEPMQAHLAKAPLNDPAWTFEPKLDGYRVLAFVDHERVQLRSRGGLDLTRAFPEIARELALQAPLPMILDGELIALHEGRPSFNALQNRAQLKTPTEVAIGEREVPCMYYCFDILHAAGRNLRKSPYTDRRRYLAQCLLATSHVQQMHADDNGAALYRAALQAGFEGVVAKKKSSAYHPGRRSQEWLKTKASQSEDFVVGGYTAGEGSRRGSFGALVLGEWRDGKLYPVGHVGSGFDDKTLAAVLRELAPLATRKRPFAVEPQLNASVTWVKPQRVAEVQFSCWTPARQLREPVFLRLRDDLAARRITADKRARAMDPFAEQVTGVEEQLTQKAEAFYLHVGEHRIKLTHLDKTLWPVSDVGPPVTKRHLLRYLARAARHMLPHLRDRPFTAVRMPDGTAGERFFQKHWEGAAPGFAEWVELYSDSKHVNQRYLLCNNLATLLWLGQMGALEFHVWHSRVDPRPESTDAGVFVGSLENIERSALNCPDYVVFDIDPYVYSGKEAPGAEPDLNRRGFDKGREVALRLRALLQTLSLRAFVKTTGKTGLHVFVPIERSIGFREARAVSELIGRHLTRERPQDITMQWRVEKRPGKIFIDHNMNRRGSTLAAAYSPRSSEGAPVSMPLSWEELERTYPTDFTVHSAMDRLLGVDPWQGILDNKQDLERAFNLAAP